MSEFQSIVAIILALIIGFAIGRGSRKQQRPSQTELTREEQHLLSGGGHSQLNYDDVHWDIRQAIEAGRTVEAIKLYRQHHGSGLKEAKETIEEFIRNLK